MKTLQDILYGIIIGHWLMNVWSRACPTETAGRYVVVGMHSSREEYVVIARFTSHERASVACDYVEDYALQYIGLLYDMCDPGDRAEFMNKKFTDYVEPEDEPVIEYARCLCSDGK